MAVGWRWMTGWWAGLAIVTLILARSLHRVLSKICRPRDELRSGTLQDLTPTAKDAKFEIIAVPGLGAHPYHTWEARRTPGLGAAEDQTAQSAKVHLLTDLLARDFPDARIWNFVHDSNWLVDAPVKTTAEIGKCLLTEIKDKRSSSNLPIIFIGHSLGGIIIKQALCRNDSQEIADNTSGILFLGTPHQGSSVSIAGAMLAWMTGFLGSDTTLLLSLKSNDQQLSTLAATFKQRIASSNKRRQENIRITSFYETKKTYLLGLSLGVVVSQNSAVVHDDADESHSIETDHSGLNKCGGSTDTLYTKLTGAIRHLKAPSLLEQADTWIREKHYTANRLEIRRLSGKQLSMDQCYINLTIVEQSGQDAGRSTRESEPSPFSILDRQKVTAPDKTIQVELSELFNKRKGSDGRLVNPRRILIRGRAGVGKTTLCKKIIYEFTEGNWGKWNDLFDRVLWVPLRNLKLPERCKKAKYTFEHLFSHEFLLPTNGQNLAGALSLALAAEKGKTLFLLDGLDEVSQDLTGDAGMSRFLTELLSQPSVIITARPSAKPPANLDLELETIGFGPDQVDEYIEKSFTNPKTSETDQAKIRSIQSFLRERWLIQGLVRIPIQLDALCYSWDDFRLDEIPNTMTHLYEEIELKLWKKDILRLEKKHGDKELAEEHFARASRRTIEGFVKDELAFIEYLAFTGLHNDIIEFTAEHLNCISDHFSPCLLPDKTLPSLSFLRASNPSSEYRYQNYHFIHLTFQEYFAARYFAQLWKDQKAQLQFLTFNSRGTQTTACSPTAFLRKHKYTTRYDIFWRFVAGLLDGSGRAPNFMNIVEDEPIDLLGPAHQRLVMHCLSEISSNLPTQEALEKRLAWWLLFECKFNGSAGLASEVEFPELALQAAFFEGSIDTHKTILWSLANRASIPRSIIEQVVARLDDEDLVVRSAAVKALGGHAAVPDEVLLAVATRLDDEHAVIRRTAVEMLGARTAVPDGILNAVVARLNDQDWHVRSAAVEVLGRRTAVPEEVLKAVVARLDDENVSVRRAAVKSLGGRAVVPDEVLMAVATRLDDEHSVVRRAAIEALVGRAAVSDEVLEAVAARIDDEHPSVRKAAVEALGKHSSVPDEMLRAVAARLNDEHPLVESAAVEAIGGRAAVSDEMLRAVEARLDNEHPSVRRAAVEILGRCAAMPDERLRALAARLNDEDELVRRATVEALGRRVVMPDEILKAVAARLEDDDGPVRSTAVKVLGERVAVPNEVFKAVVARLEDEHPSVRRAVVETLGGHAVVPNVVLEAVVVRLDDEDLSVRRAAVDASMRMHEKINRNVPRRLITSLYKALLEQSFVEQVSWYIEKDSSYVNMTDGIREFPIVGQLNDVKKWINGARPAEYPSSVHSTC